MTTTNPFENDEVAEQYQMFRPRYHHIPFDLIRSLIRHDFESSLDVACGTGHSTTALSKISKNVIGVDNSEAMLRQARQSSKIKFIKAEAENLPFEDSSFDFLNISMGFHWVDQKSFLKEAQRVLKKHGFLSIDHYGFSGKISQNFELQNTHHELFNKYLPPASSQSIYPSENLISETNFQLVKELEYEHIISLNASEFLGLIMTWSNFQVLSSDQKDSLIQKMKDLYNRVFENNRKELLFNGKTHLYTNLTPVNNI